MQFLKRLLKSSAVQTILAFLCAGYIRLVYLTTRWEIRNRNVPQRYWDAGEPFIACFWHGRLLMMRFCWPRSIPVHVLISDHSDGRLIAATMRRLGLGTIVGSTSRGGAAALLAMRRLLNNGISVGITPDGPRGPRMRAAPGVIKIASITGAPIVPMTCASSRRRVLSSWDRFVFTFPFGRGVFAFGDPITVPRDADADAFEAARAQLEQRLNALTQDVDHACGQLPIEPAPVSDTPADDPAGRPAGGPDNSGARLRARSG